MRSDDTDSMQESADIACVYTASKPGTPNKAALYIAFERHVGVRVQTPPPWGVYQRELFIREGVVYQRALFIREYQVA